jgi:hypothetical protein
MVLSIQTLGGESAAAIRMLAGSASTSVRPAGCSKRTAPQISVVGAPPSP